MAWPTPTGQPVTFGLGLLPGTEVPGDLQDTASETSTLSRATSGTNRSAHMQYLMGDLGLDQATAALMYKAERLQEKGQSRQALRYFKNVLETKPDCMEAASNVRMLEATLRDERRLESVPEQTPAGGFVTEMHVDWTWIESVYDDSIPDFDAVALRHAHCKLAKSSHNLPLVKLLKNDVIREICDHNTDYLSFVEGRALVQVGFPPQAREASSAQAQHGLGLEAFAQLLAANRAPTNNAQHAVPAVDLAPTTAPASHREDLASASASGLSATSSRMEHMAYLTGTCGLDEDAAALMYRAERLQDKGQLQQALCYYDRVVADFPHCRQAGVNARMIRDMLERSNVDRVSCPNDSSDVVSVEMTSASILQGKSQGLRRNLKEMFAVSLAAVFCCRRKSKPE